MKKVFGNEAARCQSCDFPIGDEHPYTWCVKCGEPLSKEVLLQVPTQAAQASHQPATGPTATTSGVHTPDVPILAVALYILAALAFLGGIIGAIAFAPGDAGIGYTWKATAYTGVAVWLAAGVVEAAIFAAAGKVLEYLNQIALNTRRNND